MWGVKEGGCSQGFDIGKAPGFGEGVKEGMMGRRTRSLVIQERDKGSGLLQDSFPTEMKTNRSTSQNLVDSPCPKGLEE